MVKRLLAFLLASGLGAYGAAYTSAASGFWSDPATWGGAGCPTNDGDSFTIQAAHTVTFNADLSSLPNGLGAGVINGILDISVGSAVHYKMNGNITGTGRWYIGASDDPVTYTADNRPSVVIEQRGGTVQLSTAGGVQWYGDTNSFWGFITNTVPVGGTDFFFAEDVSNVASNDIIAIDNHNVRGAAGSLHMVKEVAINRITVWDAIPTWAGLVTNTWPGSTIIGGVASNNRTNGTLVVKLSRPIVVYQPSRISSTAPLNTVNTCAVAGVRSQQLGRSLANGGRDLRLYGCVAVTNYYGLVHAVSGVEMYGCASYTSGPMVAYGIGTVCEGCIALSPVNAGLQGALDNGGVATVARRCLVANTGMPLAYASLCLAAYECAVRNNSSQAFGYNAVDSVFVASTNRNSGGALANLANNNRFVMPVTDYASTWLLNAVGGELWSTNHTHSGLVQLRTGVGDFDVTLYNGTNHVSAYGAVVQTNWGTDILLAHRPTATGWHVPYYLDVSLKPNSTRSVEIGTYGVADCYYGYAVTYPRAKPESVIDLPSTAGQWSYTSVTLTNTLPVPASWRLWVTMTNATAATEGWTRVNLPTDYTVRVQ